MSLMTTMGSSCALLLFSLVILAVSVWAQKSSLMPDYFDHPCVRTCKDDVEPMDCQYRFVVESYQTMSKACYDCAAGNVTDCARAHCVPGNGFSRNIKTVNRRLPGPTIQVCEGDTVTVDLENYFSMAEGVTIHWHGILQHLTPHMDGVGMITQCPIPAYTTFQYRFVAMDYGTHFWHAHTGLQRGEGVFGSLVVRQSPSRKPHTDIYDFDLPEHVIIVNEWQNRPLVEIYTAFHHSDGAQAADSIMINGHSQDPTGNLNLPRAEFEVEPGQRYRFRVINSGSLFCPIQISVDSHNLTIIASDGRAVEPFVVGSFDTYSAERYDFILTTDQPVDTYWLRARGLGACESNELEEQAVIRYLALDADQDHSKLKSVPAVTARLERIGVPFNNVPVETTVPLGDARDQILGMSAVAPDDRSLTGDPDHQFILDFSASQLNNLHYFDPDLYPAGSGPYTTIFSAQISRITNRLGPVPLLSQMSEIPQDMFCNETTVAPECQTEWCECIHKLTVHHDQLVEVVLISPSGQGFTHPIHMHGYSYRVVAMERGPDGIMSPELFREMDARGDIDRKLSQAPFKDTVPLPNGGYVILRFVADNPGVWFVHCHLAFHAEIGMSLALEVLQSDGQLPPPPPGFPTCGPFVAPAPQDSLRSRHTPAGGEQMFGAGNSNQQQASAQDSNSNSNLPSSVVPQWVLPLVVSMSVVIIALIVAVVSLWKRTRKTQRRERIRVNFPSYSGVLGRRETTLTGAGDQLSGEGSGDHFTYSKKQEKAVLTP